MIRLIVLFLVVSAVTPFAMNTILPDPQKTALKSWMLSNEMTFFAGVLFGDKEVPDAPKPSDFMGAITSLDYTEGWDKLKQTLSSAGEGTTASLEGLSNVDAQGAVDQIQSLGSGAEGTSEDSFPANSWFDDYQFDEKTQVHDVYGGGCGTANKTVSFNVDNCQ